MSKDEESSAELCYDKNDDGRSNEVNKENSEKNCDNNSAIVRLDNDRTPEVEIISNEDEKNLVLDLIDETNDNYEVNNHKDGIIENEDEINSRIFDKNKTDNFETSNIANELGDEQNKNHSDCDDDLNKQFMSADFNDSDISGNSKIETDLNSITDKNKDHEAITNENILDETIFKETNTENTNLVIKHAENDDENKNYEKITESDVVNEDSLNNDENDVIHISEEMNKDYDDVDENTVINDEDNVSIKNDVIAHYSYNNSVITIGTSNDNSDGSSSQDEKLVNQSNTNLKSIDSNKSTTFVPHNKSSCCIII